MNDAERGDLGEPDTGVSETVEIEKQFGLPEETARIVAEDIEANYPRKPGSYAVELERIHKAQELDEKPPE
jgi:hypothetical protein